MCLLIVLRGRFASHPVLVASNRDERRDRKASPPGLWVGERHRAISPRDRQAGGTWLAVGDSGLFAGITNRKDVPVPPGAATRGALPHLAVDAGDLAGAVAAVQRAVAAQPFGGFQLVLCDGVRTVVLRNDGARLDRLDWSDELLIVSNEHGPGELTLPGLEPAVAPRGSPEAQLEALQPLLLLTGSSGEHRVLKRGADYGTVSSSLIAVPRNDPLQLVWRFAAGPPDVNEYRNYGNLGRRLLRDGSDLSRDRPPL
jgi:hypothetical protein